MIRNNLTIPTARYFNIAIFPLMLNSVYTIIARPIITNNEKVVYRGAKVGPIPDLPTATAPHTPWRQSRISKYGNKSLAVIWQGYTIQPSYSFYKETTPSL
jgi:hypothetical protein